LGLLLVSTQVPLQAVCPGGHCCRQLPFIQLVPLWQTWPQEPQLLLSLLVSTQLPLQQLLPFWQTVPQEPQLLLSLLVSTQLLPQSVPDEH
jgi:hypothetical protein